MTNMIKYESYKFAHRQMKKAITEGYFIEAITIQESLISDRLNSYLKRPESPHKFGDFTGFATLINALEKEVDEARIEDFDFSIDMLNSWRKQRNDIVHAIAKSSPGTSTIPVEEFLDMARKAAIDGMKLSRNVLRWHKRCLRQSS